MMQMDPSPNAGFWFLENQYEGKSGHGSQRNFKKRIMPLSQFSKANDVKLEKPKNVNPHVSFYAHSLPLCPHVPLSSSPSLLTLKSQHNTTLSLSLSLSLYKQQQKKQNRKLYRERESKISKSEVWVT